MIKGKGIMARKSGEMSFRGTVNWLSWFSHKYGDVRYCPSCHMALPKSELMPDYVMSGIYFYVEVKNSNKTGKWSWTELLPDGARSNQAAYLKAHDGWLYIELGLGRAPGGKGCYLLPWDKWEPMMDQLLKIPQKSLGYEKSRIKAFVTADELLGEYSLDWIPHTGWTIPDNHLFWNRYIKLLETQIQLVKGKLHES